MASYIFLSVPYSFIQKKQLKSTHTYFISSSDESVKFPYGLMAGKSQTMESLLMAEELGRWPGSNGELLEDVKKKSNMDPFSFRHINVTTTMNMKKKAGRRKIRRLFQYTLSTIIVRLVNNQL